ncbi:MAG: molybdopterin molybdenumtransferase MoeA, partial [bacterium]|nr:molybdopterin molybdenumtransferase MoeA [bacterium]
MIPLTEAQNKVLAGCKVLPEAVVSITQACGLVTAETVVAPELVPPFDNTAMDGFAVRSQDVAKAPVTLAIAGTVSAGAAPSCEVGQGEAVRIMTGALITHGADAVVMVELTQTSSD